MYYRDQPKRLEKIMMWATYFVLPLFLALCILLSGCITSISSRGVESFIKGQVQRNIASLGKRDLKEKFQKSNMTWDEYSFRRNELKIKKPKDNLLTTSVFILKSSGKIRIVGSKRIEQSINNAVGLRDKELDVGFSFSFRRAVLRFGYHDLELEYHQHYDGYIFVLISYSVRF